MKSAFQEVKLFISVHALVLIGSLVVIFATDQNELHLWFNQFHNPFFDQVFKYATHMAEGLVIGFMVFIILIFKVRYAIAGLIGIVVSGMVTQFFKHKVFNDHFRPAKVFDGIANLHFVDGVSLHKAFSFPSGHSTAAFALFLFLAFTVNNRKLELLCYALALITAFSRVYLSQHFFEDITVGSIIGTTVCFVILALFKNQKWGEKGLLANFETNRNKS